VIALGGLQPHEVARLVPVEPVLVCYRGSHAHGTHVAPEDPNGFDDVDILTVYIDPRPSVYFGVDKQQWAGRDAKVGKWDACSYGLQHFAKLAATCNPNVIASLWLDERFYIHLGWQGECLVANRDMFSSKLAHKSFGGYAHSQLKRMTAWRDQKADCGCEGEYHSQDCPLKDEKGRGSSKLYATGFMGAKRKALVEKYGYDTKNAAHLIRLLRMGKEFLELGHLQVYRHDADELLAIKRGEWPLECVKKEAEVEFAHMDEALRDSPLPDKPDFHAIDRMVTDIMCQTMHQAVLSKAIDMHRRVWVGDDRDWSRIDDHVLKGKRP